MEKNKKWPFFLILVVLVLTVYNIVPTLIFYAQPLHEPIEEKRAISIAEAIAERVNTLESDAESWLRAYCRLLGVLPLHVHFDPRDPQIISLQFQDETSADRLRTHLPKAGSLIPFLPARLGVRDLPSEADTSVVTVQRKIPLHFDQGALEQAFRYSPKFDVAGNPSPFYRMLVEDRLLHLAAALSGPQEHALLARMIVQYPNDMQVREYAYHLARNLREVGDVCGEDSPAAKRYYASFTQADISDRHRFVAELLQGLHHMRDRLRLERVALEKGEELHADDAVLSKSAAQERLPALIEKEGLLSYFASLLERHTAAFAAGHHPLDTEALRALLARGGGDRVSFGPYHPFFQTLVVDFSTDTLSLHLHSDLLAWRERWELPNGDVSMRDRLDQILYNEVAQISRLCSEKIVPKQHQFAVVLSDLYNSRSVLAMDMGPVADAEVRHIQEQLRNCWHPVHQEFSPEAFPLWERGVYATLPADQKKFGLVVYAPIREQGLTPQGLRKNSIYVIAKGVGRILESYQDAPHLAHTAQFVEDFRALQLLMQENGFYGYSGTMLATNPEFASDFIFEKADYFQNLLKATREDFIVRGTKQYAIVELSDLEQRILTENQIDTQIHEDLLRWRDDYAVASLNLQGLSPLDVPPPTRNVYWSNWKLSAKKFFRGDERKILHWGLDMSGGKTVQIELHDANNRVVTNEADLRQARDELFERVNKMGISEVSLRQEGHTLSLDFPGAQSLSATELVKASTMYFHVVNEKFGPGNLALREHVQKFLQDIWNEAVITHRRQPEDIQQIAWKQIHGESIDPESLQPRSTSAQVLFNEGLRLANPFEPLGSNGFNDAISTIALYRGDDFSQWHGQTHPLLIVFRNYALEGSNLEQVMASYDPAKGNFLSFGIRSSSTVFAGGNPRDGLENWTSRFCRSAILGTPMEKYTGGKGARMAVILNGSVISAPTLDSPLRDSAMISGSFTQREVYQLEADIKAGSLSFTPKILSEKNVSPELGQQEKQLGITGIFLSFIFVVVVMVAYYRFAGWIASLAVLCNLLILWATLQNLEATMTLAGIAAMILTVGMAVDANVLIFERIREEFAVTRKIAVAVRAGYRKAFAAILDSNITTLIAALVLLNFDSGPIKGFAVTLIVGLVSSLFTALFMTRYFFAHWVRNPEHKRLNMANWFKRNDFPFLQYTHRALMVSLIVIVAGAICIFQQRHTFVGLDFTGGYSISIPLEPQSGARYRHLVETALERKGAYAQDIQVRELDPSSHVRVFLSRSMEQPGRPFYAMPSALDDKEPEYPYQTNPRILWIVSAIQEAGLEITPENLQALAQNWTSLSGQMSDSMRTNALIGLLIAMICIWIYITVRFEFAYATAATLCLLHDVAFTVATMGVLHLCGLPIQIDLHTVAALMTIIGYSLNDTIIVFDRIREDLRRKTATPLPEVIQHALNTTLSRTMLTSGTTLLVLLPLVVLGGSTVFSFAFVMVIGIIFGTFSSLFIAAPLMQFFYKRELQKAGIVA